MTPPESTDGSTDEGRCASLVLRCQQEYDAWQITQDPDLGAVYRQSLEELYQLLADDLHSVARSWTRKSNQEVEALAMSQFVAIVMALPKIDVDPRRNVRHLLITIGRRGLIDDYRRETSFGPRRRPKRVGEDSPPESGTAEARMWRAPGEQPGQVASLDHLANIADTNGASVEERTARLLDGQAILDAARKFWQQVCSAIDCQIMRLRYDFDPPYSFAEIAARLGPGWMEATVRQRHKRLLDATRRHLREHGLLDELA